MTSEKINLESPNVKTDDAGQVLLTYEEIVEQIQEKIQVSLRASQFYAYLHLFSVLNGVCDVALLVVKTQQHCNGLHGLLTSDK